MRNKDFVLLFKIIVLPFFVAAGFFVLSAPARALDITDNVIWTKAQSPIVVSERVWVKSGGSLIIEPGVVVKFYPDQFITAAGTFNAIGTEEEPIIFTSIKDDEYGGDTNGDGSASQPQVGDWNKLSSGSGSHSTLQHILARYGGVLHSDGIGYYSFVISTYKGNVDITDAIITNNGGGISNDGGQLNVTNSSIHNNLLLFDNMFFDVGIANNSQADIVNAANNWWGTAEGPCPWETLISTNTPGSTGEKIKAVCGEKTLIDAGVVYSPWLLSDPFQPTVNPVIIVPGILGSYLNRNESGSPEVWPNVDAMLLPGDDDYLNELALTPTGWPDFSDNLIATDAIRKILTSDFFEGLIAELTNNGYKEGENLFVFPYDWRIDINWLAGESPLPNHPGLKEKIEEIKAATGADKVDIIAHSMGGLVVKKYLQKYGNSSVDKFIDIATPHLGAPKAFKALMYGDDFGFSAFGLGLNQNTVKFISQNMPAVYQLLPSQEYFNINDFNIPDPDYENYIYDIHDLDANGVMGALNYSQTQEFMNNTSRNSDLLALSDNLHQEIDNLVVSNTFNIIGCGKPTIGKIYVLNEEKSGGFEYALKYISGDSTVPLRSAEAMDSSKIYIKGSEHANIPSAEGAKQLAASILKGEQADFNFSQYPNLSLDKNICSFSGTQISYHSPIELHIYDENNNHLGPDENGDIEMGIDGANYDIIEGNKFAFLPEGHTYRIVGEATASGFFNARIENIENGEYKETVYYNEVPLQTAQTAVNFNVYDGQSDYSMAIDNEGDGVIDAEIPPSSVLNENEADDLIKPQTSIDISGEEGNNNWYVSDVQIELIAQDEEGGSGILKTEYSLDNGQTWNIYQAAFILSEEGEHKILYASTDRAGNVEEVKEANVKIDKSGPVIQFVTPVQNQKFLHSEIFNIAYSAEDNYSGIASNTLAAWLDNKTIDISQPVDLFYLPLGEHYLKISLADAAGNVSTVEVRFIVAATIESSISDINRSYKEGMITKRLIRDTLAAELKVIQQYIKKHNKKYKPFILKQYQLILKELAFYYRKG